ncbi:MAG: hypothetical protein R3250_01150 [Melioribacteraceae bacterium]|nr:hypothetical protein [Melioribacteraceae bacterium]
MNEEVNFYAMLAKILLIFNFLSLFFTFTIVLIYAFIEYVGLQVLDIAINFFGTSGFWYESFVNLFELMLELPGGLDTLFMALIVLTIMNMFFVAYKTKQGGWTGFFFFISIGMPIWLFIAKQVVELRNTLLNYLNSTLIIKPETTFFDYFTMYSLEVSAFIFITSIIIHMVDWENVREKIGEAIGKQTAMEDSIDERFEQ